MSIKTYRPKMNFAGIHNLCGGNVHHGGTCGIQYQICEKCNKQVFGAVTLSISPQKGYSQNV